MSRVSEIRIVTVVGNPKAGSRTLTAASTLASGVAERLREVGEFDPVVAEPIDLAVIADGLLAPWRLSPAAANAVDSARSAAVLVLATPTYKASFTGLLKLFLDTLPAGSLATAAVLPLTVAGGPGHRQLADLQLRPVLSELGAAVPTPSLLLEEAQLAALPPIVEDFLDRHAAVLTATVAALRRPAVTARTTVTHELKGSLS